MNKPICIHNHYHPLLKKKKIDDITYIRLQKKKKIMGGQMKGLVKSHLILKKISFGYNWWYEITYFIKGEKLREEVIPSILLIYVKTAPMNLKVLLNL